MKLKHNKFTIILLVALLFFACNKSTTDKKLIEFSEFPLIDSISDLKIEEFKEIPSNSDFLISENYYISFSQGTSRGFYFTVFSKNTLSPVAQFAKQGSAPHELRLGAAPSIDADNNKVYIVDVARNQYVFEYNLSEAVSNAEYIPKKLFKYGYDNCHTIRFKNCFANVFLTQYIMGSNDSIDYQYTFIDNTGTITGQYEPINYPAEYPVYVRKSLAFSEKIYNNGRIYTAFANQDKILCFDFEKKETVFETRGPRIEFPEIEIDGNSWIPDKIPAPMSYNSIAVSNKYIYTVNTGKYKTIHDKVSIESNYLGVFNLKGEPVKKIKLNVPIMKVYFDKYTNEIICMAETKSIYNTIGIIRISVDKIE